jgi:hypothetical protein
VLVKAGGTGPKEVIRPTEDGCRETANPNRTIPEFLPFRLYDRRPGSSGCTTKPLSSPPKRCRHRQTAVILTRSGRICSCFSGVQSIQRSPVIRRLGAPYLDSQFPASGFLRNPRSENPDLGHPSSRMDRDVGHQPYRCSMGR